MSSGVQKYLYFVFSSRIIEFKNRLTVQRRIRQVLEENIKDFKLIRSLCKEICGILPLNTMFEACHYMQCCTSHPTKSHGSQVLVVTPMTLT